jgi:hypothetical protein
VQTLSGGLPSLLYVHPPPPSPGPDARRGGVAVTPRVLLQLQDIDFRGPATGAPPGIEVMEWRGERAPKPPAAEPPWQCPECLVGHWESAVIVQRTYTSTMLATSFYDKTDELHVHDPNILTTWYACTRGHRWTTQETIVCPNIGCIWPTIL